MNLEHAKSLLEKLGAKNMQVHDNKVVCSCLFASKYHSSGQDSRPSFAFFANDQGFSGFICKACHLKGSAYKLIFLLGKAYNRDMSEFQECARAYENSRDYFVFENLKTEIKKPEKPVPLDSGAIMQFCMDRDECRPGIVYCANRGIDWKTWRKLGLLYDAEQRRVVFPVYGRDWNLYGFTGRSIDPGEKIKVRDYKGLPKKHLILGCERWKRNYPVIIVEGLFGYAWLHKIGVEKYANIGALLGSVLTKEKVEILENFGEPVYLMLDNDQGGDFGLFGITENGEKLVPGAVDMLYKKVLLFVPEWPYRKNGTQKDDPDQLTLKEINDILQYTKPYFKRSRP